MRIKDMLSREVSAMKNLIIKYLLDRLSEVKQNMDNEVWLSIQERDFCEDEDDEVDYDEGEYSIIGRYQIVLPVYGIFKQRNSKVLTERVKGEFDNPYYGTDCFTGVEFKNGRLRIMFDKMESDIMNTWSDMQYVNGVFIEEVKEKLKDAGIQEFELYIEIFTTY